MSHGRGRGFSGLRGSISTDFNDGVNDRGAFGGKANPDGFNQDTSDTPYRYGYPSPLQYPIYHPHYHDMHKPEETSHYYYYVHYKWSNVEPSVLFAFLLMDSGGKR